MPQMGTETKYIFITTNHNITVSSYWNVRSMRIICCHRQFF